MIWSSLGQVTFHYGKFFVG